MELFAKWTKLNNRRTTIPLWVIGLVLLHNCVVTGQHLSDFSSTDNKFEYVPNNRGANNRDHVQSDSNPWGENQRERMHTDYLTQYTGKKSLEKIIFSS